MNEIVLGFDARETGPRAEARWTESRRRTCLLREAPLPLSVDEMVWPTAFAELAERRRDREATALSAGGTPAFTPSGWIPRPRWIGPNDHLWDNLGAMETQIRATSRGPDRHGKTWEIAITWHGPDFPEDAGLNTAPTVPETRDASWRLLGFDVADPNITGLSNCEYDAAERGLAATWAPCLNEHHLFAKIEDADVFRVFTNERVREHAPFYVLGLWRVGA